MAVVNQSAQELALLSQSIRSGKERSGGGGLISGPILDAINKPKRERAAAEDLAIEGGRGKDILGASGIDQSTVDPERLGSLQGLLADPNTRAEGVSALNEIEAAQGINTPLATLNAAGQVQNRLTFELNKAVAGEERTMRSAWQTGIRPIVDVLQSVDLARNQLQLASPEAALNSARLFIQQLDKSMVTNPEITNVIQQQGLAGQLTQFMNWAEGGGNFDDATRKRMVDSMVAVGEVYKQYGDGLMQQTQELASRSSLPINPENVTTMGGYANRDFDLSFPGNKEKGPGNDQPVDNATTVEEAEATADDDGVMTIIDSNGLTRRVRRVK